MDDYEGFTDPPPNDTVEWTTDEPVGASGVPHDVEVQVGDLIAKLAERYEIKGGTTATFFHVCAALAHHVGEGLQ